MTQQWDNRQHTNGKTSVKVNENENQDLLMVGLTSDKLDKGEKKTQSNGVLLGLLLGVIGTFIAMRVVNVNYASRSESTVTPTTEISATNVSQPITTTQVEVTQVANQIDVTGTVSAFELIPVMSSANNLQLKEVLVDEGDFVEKGDILIRLDDTILRAELAQALAGLNQAQARLAELKAGTRQEELARAKENVTYAQAEVNQAQSDLLLASTRLQRNRQLEDEGAIAKDRLDEFINDELSKKSNLIKAKARLREAKQRLEELEKGERQEVITQGEATVTEAQARVNLVEARLNETVIFAPVTGKIAQRNARVGDVTSSFNSQSLFTIIEDNRLNLELKVPENELKNIREGKVVNIFSSANRNIQLTGKVRDINPIIDAQSRQGIVNVDLPPNTDLKPGMFLQARIVTNVKPSLTVPMGAVLPQTDGKGLVYLVNDDNTVTAQIVTLGEIVANDRLEILSGLQKGDAIALQGVNYLQDGSQVNILGN